MNINFEELKRQALKELLKLKKYNSIMETVKKLKKGIKIDDAEKAEFRKNYITYYDMFYKSEKWQQEFFIYFEKCLKDDNIKISKVLEKLAKLDEEYDVNHKPKVEFSFASKLIATINPDMPIWDSNVAQKLGEEISQETKGILIKVGSKYMIDGYDLTTKINNAIRLYETLIKVEKEITKKYKREIEKFKEYFIDEYDLSDEKILDFYLWKLK